MEGELCTSLSHFNQFSLHIFVNFMESELTPVFDDVFDHFFCEIMKLQRFEWIQYLDVSDVIHANEHT